MSAPELLVRPQPNVAEIAAYEPRRRRGGIDVWLDANEAGAPLPELEESLRLASDTTNRYPKNGELESYLSELFRIDREQVLVTAGGDDGLERGVRAVCSPGREVILTNPGFEMLERYVLLSGGSVNELSWWSGEWPVDEAIAMASSRTCAIAMVSPNNPTGSVVGAAELTRLAQALPGVLVLLDLAYVEFADEDLTPTALELPNVVVFRTLSKAWAAAGLRVGYAMGDARVISWLRAAGQPYPVSAPSLIAARRLLSRAQGVGSHVEGVLRQRDRVLRGLRELGLEAMDSQANFVLVYFQDAQWTLDALAGLGIGVRSFPGRPGLEGWLRITIPSEESLADRLLASLRTVLRPQALFFDLDGVLADVSRSYRLAILQTASAFGVELAPDEIAQAKAAGNSNNDWLLTQALLRRHGVEQPLSEIRELFEGLYQGADGQRGLWRDEPLLISRGLLDELAAQYPLAIVTGRPRSDAVRFLEMHRVQEFFDAVVTLEDGPSKPDPTPVLRALDALAVERAWMLGDTPDDVAAARAAGVLPVGVMAPGDDVGLAREGLRDASRVLRSVNEIQEILP